MVMLIRAPAFATFGTVLPLVLSAAAHHDQIPARSRAAPPADRWCPPQEPASLAEPDGDDDGLATSCAPSPCRDAVAPVAIS
jgi:hypothetical protein